MGTRLNPSQVIGAWNKEHLKLLKSNLDSKQPLLIPGGGIAMSGAGISAAVDGSTVSVNASGQLAGAYSGGAGIEVSGGGISVASDALDSVTQIISSGAVARGGSDGSGGYFYVTDSGAVMGVSGSPRVSVGESAVTVKGSGSTGLYINAGVTRVLGGGSTVVSAAANSGILMAGNASGGYVFCSKAENVYIKHYDDDQKYKAVHMGMSATSDTLGIVRPDNSTCTVDSAGTLTCIVSGGTSYSAGPGIEISNSQISVSVDSSTVGFDSNGALSCMVSGGSGGTSYSAGPGIVISNGGISLASDAIQQVPQVMLSDGTAIDATGIEGGSNGFFVNFSSSVGTDGQIYAVGRYNSDLGKNVNAYYACLNSATIRSPNSSFYFAATNNRITMGSANIGFGVMGGSGAVISAGANGFVHLRVSGSYTRLYGMTSSAGLYVYGSGTSGVVAIKHYEDSVYYKAVHTNMSATSESRGVVRPDNSTCSVASGGILSMVPPVTEWTSGNAGSEVTYSQISGAQVLNLYRNGLLMQSGEDYTLSDGVVSYATPLASSEKVAFQYWPVSSPARGLMKGSPGNDGALPDEFPEENSSGEKGEER